MAMVALGESSTSSFYSTQGFSASPLYLSRYTIQNKNAYYELLQGVTADQAWEPWILYMLSAIRETAEWTASRILSIRDLFELTLEKCRQQLPKTIYSKELVELIFTEPYCKISFLVEAGLAERKTASKYLHAIEQLGILEGENIGREMIYKHPFLLQILTE